MDKAVEAVYAKHVDELQKFKEFYWVFVNWMSIHHKGRPITQYFKEKGYQTAAIYGMRELGELLYDELYDSEIKIEYVIDQKPGSVYAEVLVLDPDSILPEVDVVVVTAIHYYDEIQKVLSQKLKCPIVGLNTIVYSLNY